MSTSSAELKGIMPELPFRPILIDGSNDQDQILATFNMIIEETRRLELQLNNFIVESGLTDEIQSQQIDVKRRANIHVLEKIILWLKNQINMAQILMLQEEPSFRSVLATLSSLQATIDEFKTIYLFAQSDLIDEIIKHKNTFRVDVEIMRLRAATIAQIVNIYTEMGIEIPFGQLSELFGSED